MAKKYKKLRQRALSAATDITPPGEPRKLSKDRLTLPAYLTTSRPSDSILSESDNRIANLDITSLRSGTSTKGIINDLTKASPDLSAAVASAIRMAISQTYTAVAYNLDGTINPDGTRLAQQLTRKFDHLGAYDVGFNHTKTIRSASEALARELLVYGSCGLELVLDKARLPDHLAPVSTRTVVFRQEQKRLVPYQKIGSEEISLDIPTFFYTSLDQDLATAYSESPIAAAVQPVLMSQAFMNDLRRIFRRAIHPRQTAEIDTDRWKANIPPDVAHDSAKFEAYMQATISDLETKMNGLAPEDALIYFDLIKMDILDKGNVSLSEEYKVLSAIMDGKLASGARTMPVVLSHAAASSTNIASTQSMLFVKQVEGAVQAKLHETFSRALTLGVRLFGLDVIVGFAYEPTSLRPELELEGFRAMRQSRMLELLSLGLVSDEEASILLTGSLPPAGAKPLSGTGFFKGGTSSNDNPASNTSPGQGSALNQSLAPDTPANKRGS